MCIFFQNFLKLKILDFDFFQNSGFHGARSPKGPNQKTHTKTSHRSFTGNRFPSGSCLLREGEIAPAGSRRGPHRSAVVPGGAPEWAARVSACHVPHCARPSSSPISDSGLCSTGEGKSTTRFADGTLCR